MFDDSVLIVTRVGDHRCPQCCDFATMPGWSDRLRLRAWYTPSINIQQYVASPLNEDRGSFAARRYTKPAMAAHMMLNQPIHSFVHLQPVRCRLRGGLDRVGLIARLRRVVQARVCVAVEAAEMRRLSL